MKIGTGHAGSADMVRKQQKQILRDVAQAW